MDPTFPEKFQRRMRGFEMRHPPRPGEVAVSIKVRVDSGCFHRDHSPHAYALIDEHLHRLSSSGPDFAFEEHESGPEILVYVASGVALATSIINLVAAIIKARSEGVKKGDRPAAPIELVVRRTVGPDSVQDEVVMRCDHADAVSAKVIRERMNEVMGRLLGGDATPSLEAPPSHEKPNRKRNRPA